jgi:membrane protein EpsK
MPQTLTITTGPAGHSATAAFAGDAAPAIPVPDSRTAVNVAANVANFGLTLGVAFCLTPFLLRSLGIALYGMVPLTTQLAAYLSLLTVALQATMGRYLVIALQSGDEGYAQSIFSTSAVACLAAGAVAGAAGWLLAPVAASAFNVPPGAESDAARLFGCAALAVGVTTMTSAFEMVPYALNRLEVRNIIPAASTAVRAGAIILLFRLSGPALDRVGYSMLLGAAAGLAAAITAWRCIAPRLRIDVSRVSRRAAREMLNSGSWIVLNQLGTLLFLNIDLIIANRAIGAVAAGEYGALVQISAVIRGLATAIASAFGPAIIGLYGSGNREALTRYMLRSMRVLTLALCLPLGLVCGFARPLLAAWLGPVFAASAPLLSLMLIHLAVNLPVLPLLNLQVAANRVRVPGIVTLLCGALNVGLGVVLVHTGALGVYGIALAGACALSLKNAVFTSVYAARIAGSPLVPFFRELAIAAGLVAAVTGACMLIQTFWAVRGWVELAAAGTLVSACYLAGLLVALRRSSAAPIRRLLWN